MGIPVVVRLQFVAIVLLANIAVPLAARADVFNMPLGDTSMQFITVGDPGNLADATTGGTSGAVGYTFNMGKYDVTMAQYAQFLNAVAKDDPYGLYMYLMGNDFYSPNAGILQTGSPGNYSYSVTGSAASKDNMPMPLVSWGDAARFCNWLQNGQPTGAEGNGTTETGAYLLSGGTSDAALMAVSLPVHSGNGAAKYFIPSEDEWYKAAYYKTGGTNAGYWSYTTQSNTAPDNSLVLAASESNDANYYTNHYTDPTNYVTPVGTFALSPGPYGTFDQGGDLDQWNEANVSNTYRGDRGGSFYHFFDPPWSAVRGSGSPSGDFYFVGFRVAGSVAVPEPGSIGLFVTGVVGLLWLRRPR
jgi:formylglycine-generating enzyme required for sulfatase activity